MGTQTLGYIAGGLLAAGLLLGAAGDVLGGGPLGRALGVPAAVVAPAALPGMMGAGPMPGMGMQPGMGMLRGHGPMPGTGMMPGGMWGAGNGRGGSGPGAAACPYHPAAQAGG